MELEIKSYMSTDLGDIKNWNPKSSDDVYFQLEIEIGERNIEGAHVFRLIVATREGIERNHSGAAKKSFDDMRRRYKNKGKNALIVLGDYSWESLQKILENEVEKCQSASWDESLECLRKKFFWEYENIQYRK